MHTDRRQFLQTTLAAGAALTLGARSSEARDGAQAAKTAHGDAPPRKLEILVLGGTGLIGPALVEYAVARGHKVTLFNRGKHKTDLFPTLEKLQGDRDPKKGDGIKALEGRKFDVVFDDCGYFPRHVTASAELLAKNGCGHYVYVSSISAYAKNDVEGADENAELATMSDPTIEEMGKQYEYYGPLKVLCEKAAEKALPGKTTIVRPGYIVGPGDFSDRFTYWPVRFDQGGTVLVPGAPTDPIQIIDVRDLSEWMVRLGEQRTIGTFNACGPKERLAWGTVIDACKKTSSAKDVTARWVAWKDIEQEGVEFPIWSPYEGEMKGFHTWKNARAVAAGLTFRPIDVTTKDTLAWFKSQPAERQKKLAAGPTREKEAEILAKLG